MVASMTRRLLLLRHAKSSWEAPSLPDRDRPLSKRGRSAADRMGRLLRERDLVPDVVVCSSSVRTRETLERLGLEGAETTLEDRLYGASGEELLARVREAPDVAGSLAVIAHNPGIQELAVELASGDAGSDADRLRAKFPTGALAVFEVDRSWSKMGADGATLRSFVVPKELA